LWKRENLEAKGLLRALLSEVGGTKKNHSARGRDKEPQKFESKHIRNIRNVVVLAEGGRNNGTVVGGRVKEP